MIAPFNCEKELQWCGYYCEKNIWQMIQFGDKKFQGTSLEQNDKTEQLGNTTNGTTKTTTTATKPED